MRTQLSAPLLAGIAAASACALSSTDASEEQAGALQGEAQRFLDAYEARYQDLYHAASLAEWTSHTHIVEGDDANAKRRQAAQEELTGFAGAVDTIESARALLARRDELAPLQVKQLEAVLYAAARGPQTVPELVKQLIAANTAQEESLYGFAYVLDGEELTPNDIDRALEEETDLERRRQVWECSKGVGPGLRAGLIELRRLRNATVRALGYDDYFAYKVSEYGMTPGEMVAQVETINRDLRPLFRELHTWTRYELARRYGADVPDLIPAHWLPDRWGQDWAALVDVAGFDLDAALASKEPEWLVRLAERFYVSLGFAPLPESFYRDSSLYPVPLDAGYKKNTHASAWHLDLDRDIRSLMSVEPNTRWYGTTHHELGHIYYYVSYTRPEVPLLLREGANRAYHEAIGTLMGLAAAQPRFVAAIGLAAGGEPPDALQRLLKEALEYVVFIPWSAGVMTRFEKELYADELAPERWNARWWELAARYQGIAPPSPRGEEWCDAATKTHVNDDPAEYYDYSLSFVLLFQLHDHIARRILRQDPHDTNYYACKEAGAFLRAIMAPGASVDWRQVLRETTGEGLSARAMVGYFEPLYGWLQEQNRARKATLPAL